MKFALKIGPFFCKVIVCYKMKIKGVIEDLKIKIKKNFFNLKNDNSKNISRTFSGAVRQCGVSSFSNSSLIRLILLKIYRPLPM